jgi:hypothetical protein
MSCNVSIYNGAEKVLDRVTGVVETQFTNSWYTGKARIWETNTGATVMMGDAAVTIMQTNISIPFNSGVPKKDQIVVVNSSPQDPDLVGRACRVIAVDGNGQIGAARRMTCTAYTDSDVWAR